MSDINSLKLDYHFIISRNEHGDQSDLLPVFVATCLRLYNAYLLLHVELPQSDRGSADDAAILAAMALILMYHRGDKKALLRSIVVLEYLLSHSKHNYDALLILVRLYMYLGAGSLAMDRYTRLSVKNIQHTSISWILFTRISTIHPWPATITVGDSAMTTFDPLLEMEDAIDWHQGASTLTDKVLNRMMSNKQWYMMLGLMDIQDSLDYGFARTMLLVEQQRIRRVRGIPQKATQEVVPLTVHVERDRTAFPNYASADKSTLDECLPTVVPSICGSAQWLARELTLAYLWDRLNEKQWSRKENRRLNMLVRNAAAEMGKAFTNYEAWANLLLRNLRELLSLIVKQPNPPSEVMLTQVEIVQNVVKNDLGKHVEYDNQHSAKMVLDQGLRIPLWHDFHKFYSLLEILRLIERCLSKCTAECGIKADGNAREQLENCIRDIRESCTDTQKNVYGIVTDLQYSIASSERGYLIALQSFIKGIDEVGKEISDMCSETSSIDIVCTMLQESWIDALDGVDRTPEAF